MIRKTLLALFAAVALWAAATLTCPLDDSSMMWSGQVKYENGHEFKQYHCLQGHVYWVRTPAQAGPAAPEAAHAAPAVPDTSFLVNGYKPTIAPADPRDVRAFRQQQAAGAQALQDGALRIQEKQRDLLDQRILSDAMREMEGDMAKALVLALKNGLSPKAFLDTQQVVLSIEALKAQIAAEEAARLARKEPK